MTKVLEFLRTQQTQRAATPPDPTGLYFGAYVLRREETVLLAMPLFELMILRLNEGSPEAQQLADAVLTNLGLPRS